MVGFGFGFRFAIRDVTSCFFSEFLTIVRNSLKQKKTVRSETSDN